MEPIRPSVWRRARRNTALSVRAVRIARGEYQRCPPGVVRAGARQASIARYYGATATKRGLRSRDGSGLGRGS